MRYPLVNKRLDDWVTEDFLDTRKIHFPRKDGTQVGTGLNTPKKIGGTTGSSRPSSPLAASSASDLTVNGSALLAAALQKRNGRKRKIGEKEDTSLAALPPAKKLISTWKHCFAYLLKFFKVNLVTLGFRRNGKGCAAIYTSSDRRIQQCSYQ